MRTKSTDWEYIPGSLPDSPLPSDIDISTVSSTVQQYINNPSADLLLPTVLWRDLCVFTGTLRTLSGVNNILKTWNLLVSSTTSANRFHIDGLKARKTQYAVEVDFDFETNGKLPAKGAGCISLVFDGTNWKIWIIRTWLEHFIGRGNPDIPLAVSPTPGANQAPGTVQGKDRDHYDVVVVGAGQCGLGLAGRLSALSVRNIVLEKNKHIGDNWTSRYDSAKLHTVKEYNNLPFDRTYLESDPQFIPARTIAQGFQRYVDKYGINVSLSSYITNSSWNDKTMQWKLEVDCSGTKRIITARHLVLAVGAGAAIPISPKWPGREKFKGQVLHSATYKSSKAWSGSRGLVVGSANTAHDVCEDMLRANFTSVTMVMKDATLVQPIQWRRKADEMVYNRTIPTELADRRALTMPLKIGRDAAIRFSQQQSQIDDSIFQGLEKAGFLLDRGGDSYNARFVKFGGHYVDVGTSQKIAAGTIKVKSDAVVTAFTESGLRFSDGSELEADVIVLCTGFLQDYRADAARIVGSEISSRLTDFWGVDAEGELRGAYKPSGHPRLWLHGGDFGFARFMSRFLALQIQADVLGHPYTPYTSDETRTTKGKL